MRFFDRRENVLGLVVLVTSAMFTLDLFVSEPDGSSDLEIIGWVGGTIIYIFMMFMVVKHIRDKDLSTKLLIVAMTVYNALYCMTVDLTEDFIFFQLIIMDVMAIICIFATISYIKGYQHNITRLIFMNLGLVGGILLPWALDKYFMRDLTGHWDILLPLLPSIIGRLMFIAYLFRSDIKDTSPQNELRLRLARVESSLIMNPLNYMTKEDVKIMLGLVDEGWTEFEWGPIEKECRVTITGPTKRIWYITVRKWKGEEFTRLVLSPEKDSRGSWGFEMTIIHHEFYVLENKPMVRVYGHKGVFIDIHIDNPLIEKDNAVSRGLDKLVRGF